jgi:two-component system, NarL family, nitrate/nitrite response regulator NarL
MEITIRLNQEKAMGSPIRVLIVDDHRAFRQWVRSRLESSERFEIAEEAGDGNEAIAKAQEQKPDLVLLDIGLPGMNGIETAILLRGAIPHGKILFLSENSDCEVIKAALNDGSNGFVLKSEAASELLLAIEAVLRGEKFTSKRLVDQGSSYRESAP